MNIKRDLHLLFRDKYKGHWQLGFLRDAERIKGGEPLDYVIGWMPFLGTKIDLRFKPLIPRPETEYWTEKAVKEIKKYKNPRVLDLFSGSGAVGVAVLKNIKGARIDFGEYEPDLISQIKLNLRLNNILSKRHRVFCSDVFKNIKGKYDFILANPPYIPLARRAEVHPSVLRYERKTSLFGGEDGLFFVKKFLNGLKQHIRLNGQAWVEFDSPEKAKIKKMIGACGLRGKFYKDQYGKWRYVVVYNILKK